MGTVIAFLVEMPALVGLVNVSSGLVALFSGDLVLKKAVSRRSGGMRLV